jgi:hypothetical protein
VAETRPADVRIYLTDHRRLTAVNGWRPRRDARATLGDIFNWIRGAEEQVRHALGRVLLPALVLTAATWVFFYIATPANPLNAAATTVVFGFWFTGAMLVRWLWSRWATRRKNDG